MTINDPLSWIDNELLAIEEAGLLRNLMTHLHVAGSKTIEGDGKRWIDFSSNDYLGLRHDLAAALLEDPVLNEVWGSGASPLVTGRSECHQALEQSIADFKHTEAAITFSTGYAANVGAITSLTGEGDVIFSDARNHASIIDGCRLSKAEVQVYRHNDVDHLATLCSQARGFRRRLIVTDSLFSMDGDIAPLAQLSGLARKVDAMLMVDEAHATGVFGRNGRGLAEHLDCEDGIDISVGTLSKALGSIGGFISGRKNLIHLLINKARPYIYSTAMPAVCAQAGVHALERVVSEPERREQLFKNVDYLSGRFRAAGLKMPSAVTQIMPVIIGSPARAEDCSAKLLEAGLLVPAIRPPTVPVGESLLRVSVSSQHSTEQLELLADEIARIYS